MCGLALGTALWRHFPIVPSSTPPRGSLGSARDLKPSGVRWALDWCQPVAARPQLCACVVDAPPTKQEIRPILRRGRSLRESLLGGGVGLQVFSAHRTAAWCATLASRRRSRSQGVEDCAMDDDAAMNGEGAGISSIVRSCGAGIRRAAQPPSSSSAAPRACCDDPPRRACDGGGLLRHSLPLRLPHALAYASRPASTPPPSAHAACCAATMARNVPCEQVICSNVGYCSQSFYPSRLLPFRVRSNLLSDQKQVTCRLFMRRLELSDRDTWQTFKILQITSSSRFAEAAQLAAAATQVDCAVGSWCSSESPRLLPVVLSTNAFRASSGFVRVLVRPSYLGPPTRPHSCALTASLAQAVYVSWVAANAGLPSSFR